MVIKRFWHIKRKQQNWPYPLLSLCSEDFSLQNYTDAHRLLKRYTAVPCDSFLNASHPFVIKEKYDFLNIRLDKR